MIITSPIRCQIMRSCWLAYHANHHQEEWQAWIMCDTRIGRSTLVMSLVMGNEFHSAFEDTKTDDEHPAEWQWRYHARTKEFHFLRSNPRGGERLPLMRVALGGGSRRRMSIMQFWKLLDPSTNAYLEKNRKRQQKKNCRYF